MKRQISISDVTMTMKDGASLSFREKIDMCKLLDKLGVNVIETGPIEDEKADSLLVKSLASTITDSTLAVPVNPAGDGDALDLTWRALQCAAHPRLQVRMPVSTVQMEYLCHKKPAAILSAISEAVSACAALCRDVEFVALDFSRSDSDFLMKAISNAAGSGATTISLCDMAGNLLPDEFQTVISKVREAVPAGVKLGVTCCNEMYMADACAIAAVRAGADEIKVTPYGNNTADLKRFARIMESKGDALDACIPIFAAESTKTVSQIKRLFDTKKNRFAASVKPEDHDELRLTVNDSKAEVIKVASQLGYELNDEDRDKVYEAFIQRASSNECVEAKELDAIITSVAFQVPPTYVLDSYVINSGNTFSATCHVKLTKNGEVLESVCIGDGPVDAAFHAIDSLTGADYELDDFQIQSVTEGREAMGEAVVRLRHKGNVYSGRGISTDIIGSSVLAYLSAVNKIAYEEI